MAFAGIVTDDGMAAVWTFTVGVWALALTIGVAAAPSLSDLRWWLKVFAGAFGAAGMGLVLLFGVSTVGNADREDLTTTTTSTTATVVPATTTSVP